MGETTFEIRRGAYFDSVVLMQLQRALTELPGVLDAGCVMATPANLELLEAGEILPAALPQTFPDDLLIVVKADNKQAGEEALAQVDALLQARRSGGAGSDYRPRSLENGAKMLPGAAWTLVSVPGRYAAGVAKEGLRLGKHIFLYSDNVTIDDEVKLKKEAREHGLLVMGPDCGTAIINGVGIGFANRVRRGNAGIVAASGTGLQAIAVHIHKLGGGVSQAIGAGGRDLSEAVGGVTAAQGVELLNRDPQTEVIVLASKPPSPSVTSRLLTLASQASKPVVIYFMGYAPPARRQGNLHFALNLADAAGLAMKLGHSSATLAASSEEPINGYVRGLFSGGTLAYEMVLALQGRLNPLFTNTPVHPSQKMADPFQSRGNALVDMGADDFTQGRLHPMMDNDLRLRRMEQEADDPETGALLLDLVLGEGAHPDPASELAPAIAGIRARRKLPVFVLVVGTEDDPQGLDQQIDALEKAGATIYASAVDLAETINRRFQNAPPQLGKPVDLESFQRPFAGINVGLESFYDSVIEQGSSAVHVDWRPPAGGNDKMAALLAKMRQKATKDG